MMKIAQSKTAYSTSDVYYGVHWLDRENHCSVKQQAVMANKINAIFGDLLYAPEEPPATIPSPSDLMGKIILKINFSVDDYWLLSSFLRVRLATVGNAVPENEEDMRSVARMGQLRYRMRLRGRRAGTKEKSKNKVLKIIDHDPEGLNKLSQKLFVRTYPAGSRTDSSNYNPTPMWNVGCQVGRFIVIISAYQIPKPNNSKKGEIIDPFVKIEIHGVKSDQQSVKTSVKNNNGFKPRWDEVVRFKISVPELALVRLVIYDHDRYLDDFIGYNVVPVLSMQEGYRHIPLFSKNGDKMPQALVFVHIEFEDDL
ncbi:PLCD [Mytilus edulis]|uniref:Phosphoinositide phospholipase C n=1 Tax=Mytilus edulis TaxID=6550 RepID=A0A8S3UUQ8_MYTED|nr:PLCD [Mytilus edulis]